MLTRYILSLLIWEPIIAGTLILLLSGDKFPTRARYIALMSSLITLVLSVIMYQHFDTQTYAMQFQQNYLWIKAYDIFYYIGVDGISMPLIILTCFTTLLVILTSWNTIQTKVGQYMAAFLIMQGMVIGVFSALDSILFYVFWEAMLIPMYLSIGIWGSDNRSYASIKFFLYTFFGSALMLVAILYLRSQAHSFSILKFYSVKMNLSVQMLVFFALLLAFAVKVPMFPVHTWLPDAHTEAPAGGSVVLAALMLKIGGYGFLRFSLPITPDACQKLEGLIIVLSLIAVIYIGFVAIAQKDMKKLIAYSSIAHMGFVTLGCFMVYRIIRSTGSIYDAHMSLEGAMVQMISHAFSAGAMFIGVGVLYARMHTRLINSYGGVANTMPVFAAFFMLFALSNLALPGTSGFVGEFMIILSSFQASPWITTLATTTVILSATYTLWMYKRVFYGPIVHKEVSELKDIGYLDLITFTLLAIATLSIGFYPQPLLNLFHSSVGHLLTLCLKSKL